jgi:hypothetical protein
MKRRSYARQSALFAVTVGLAATTLVGCSSAGLPMLIAAPGTSAPSSTPVPPLGGDSDGNGSLSEWEKSMLVKHSARDYTLADGTTVTIDPTQPLPAPVVAAVTAKAAPSASAANTSNADAGIAGCKALLATLDAEAASTGRGVMVVFAAQSSIDGVAWTTAASGTSQAPFVGSIDKAAIVAQATAWASARGYELIVL